jgi:hypothetical protein
MQEFRFDVVELFRAQIYGPEFTKRFFIPFTASPALLTYPLLVFGFRALAQFT